MHLLVCRSTIPSARSITAEDLPLRSSRLKRFLDRSLEDYTKLANQPDDDARSGLSPYLHFGHISPHQLFHELMSRENWSIARLSNTADRKTRGLVEREPRRRVVAR